MSLNDIHQCIVVEVWSISEILDNQKKYSTISRLLISNLFRSEKKLVIQTSICIFLLILNYCNFCNLNMIVFESSFIIFSLYLIYQNRYKNQVLWCTWSYFWCIWYFYSFLWSIWLHFTWTLKIFKTTTIFKCLEFHLIHKYYFFIRILWIYIRLENYA